MTDLTGEITLMDPRSTGLTADGSGLRPRRMTAGGLILLVGIVLSQAAESTAQEHWSLKPVLRPAVPVVQQAVWVENEIDRFILQPLERQKIAPSQATDRVTLLRRVTFDLIGLPPTEEELAAFRNDRTPEAYARVVDRLLASPRYGERWARPWMDLCHYGDSDGHLTDQLRPVAWRYRAWLVDALNENLPFDQFTIRQLAGDLLPDLPTDQLVATGFLRQTLSNREGGADLEEFRVAQIADRTAMTGTIWLGLTVACARCHDHKYDPVTQDDYYRLYAFFDNADEVNIDLPLQEEAAAWQASRADYESQREQLVAPLRAQIEELQKRWEQKALHAAQHPGEDHIWDRQWELLGLIWGGHLGEGQLEGTEIARLPWDRRTARQRADLMDYFLKQGAIVDPQKFSELKLAELGQKLIKLKQSFPQATRAPIMRAALTPRTTYIHIRGDFRVRGETVEADTPAVLPALPESTDPPRLALARWLVSQENPLTPRVVVNRAWQEFFGRGLVLSSNDFGVRGDRPSHPELLDWLADDFRRNGWDMKRLHRQIVLSATYQQSSQPRPELETIDPKNVWLARQSALRLPAESIRDAALQASGLLSQRIGGPSVRPPQPERVTKEAFGENDWTVSTGEDRYRRSLYTFIIRTSPFAQSILFDAPPPVDVCTRRVRSNTPLQALTLLNDVMFLELAESLARTVLAEPHARDEDRLRAMFPRVLARSPTDDEVRRIVAALNRFRTQLQSEPPAAAQILASARGENSLQESMTHEKAESAKKPATPDRSTPEQQNLAAWTNVASVLMNLHEFVTRD